MAKEIKRNSWSRFCRQFTSSNQYHQTIIVVDGNSEKRSVSIEPFMGMSLTKKGRFIDGIQVYSGGMTPEDVLDPVMKINDPDSIVLEKDDNGRDRFLHITSKDGTKVRLKISNDCEEQGYKNLTEKIAYTMFERRGYTIGNDMGDWLDAEKHVQQAASSLSE